MTDFVTYNFYSLYNEEINIYIILLYVMSISIGFHFK